jgi:hypothetical protein
MRGEHIPSESAIYGWIERVFNEGVRRPGYPADRWAEGWCRDQFASLGLERVRLEPVELTHWEPRDARLVAIAADGATLDIPCFPLPLAAATAEVELPLVAFDPAEPARVRGAASLYDVSLLRVPYAWYASVATSTYDPAGTFGGASQLLPFGREFQHVMEPSMEAGAAAFIGVLRGYPGDSRDYYVPYDGVSRPIPGAWISASDGDRLRAMLAHGDARVRLRIDAPQTRITTHNVAGELPGADEDTVIVGSHHDGPWSSAVEDASGIAMVMAQAAYWSRVPRRERPHHMIFLLNSGHMHNGAGAAAYCARHRADLPRTVLEVHLEHAANEFAEVDGVLQPTGEPEARWWFTSRIPRLETAVRDAIEAEDLRRSFVLPPTALGPRPTTDGSEFYVEGVPVVNFLTAPFYLFDAMDTLDKIHRPSLTAVTRAAVRIIDSTRGVGAATMRAETQPTPPA